MAMLAANAAKSNADKGNCAIYTFWDFLTDEIIRKTYEDEPAPAKSLNQEEIGEFVARWMEARSERTCQHL